MLIQVPGSTSNLGASFDTVGLAVSLYLRTSVERESDRFEIVPSGEGSETVPRDENNLIARVARAVAEDRGKAIRGARLAVHNEIPLARGLGSSSAAIIAGISVYEFLSGDRLDSDEVLSQALRFEEHPDNLAPGLLGGLVVACLVSQGKTALTVRRRWPEEIRMVVAIPDFEMETAKMRSVLPHQISRADAIYNIQRSALLQAALAEKRFDLFSEALRDRMHQPYRAPLGPGITDVLGLNDETHLHSGASRSIYQRSRINNDCVCS